MDAWLLDAYRANDKIVLWIKTKAGNLRIEKEFSTSIYGDLSAREFLIKNKIPFSAARKNTYLGEEKEVLEIPINITQYESFVRELEKKSRYVTTLYNADIAPEQQFLHKHNICPGMAIDLDTISPIEEERLPGIALKSCTIEVSSKNNLITIIKLDTEIIEGTEDGILLTFIKRFAELDPDVIIMDYAFSNLPALEEKIQNIKPDFSFHRWDASKIIYKGGKSFFSYGQTTYKDFAIRLRGRFLIDTSSTIGGNCDIDGILELCNLTGSLFQQLASRSFGACFQHSLVRLMYRQDILIPHKEKPVDIPLTLLDMLKGDRGGLTLDAKIGFHKDVAEIDFCSMFPWIIYNKNVSADTILCKDGPFETVPGLPIKISRNHIGLVPQAIKPLIDRRMEYKRNPTEFNKNKAKALKAVLVTAYGYLRFREFKLGIASSHMAICAYARDILIQSARLAEQRGFTVLHGIVDSLYLKKKNLTEEEVNTFCKELEQRSGIPVSFEGIFKWIVFLPSVNNIHRPLPATYYGVFRSGDIKARGIEVRQRKSPEIIKMFQQQILEEMSRCNSKKEIIDKLSLFCTLLRKYLQELHKFPKKMLLHKVRISNEHYKNNIPQKIVSEKLKKQGVKIVPGVTIKYFIKENNLPALEEEQSKPSKKYYKSLLVRSLFVILQPFGITRQDIIKLTSPEKQMKLSDYTKDKLIHYTYIQCNKEYSSNKGLSERQFRKMLIKQQWQVWRGGMIHLHKMPNLYPNVKKRYDLLIDLLKKHHADNIDDLEYLCQIHHGMPDFICFRNGIFKFIECKFKSEELGPRQKLCIQKLQSLGFEVEVLKFVDSSTRTREKIINWVTGHKHIIETQRALT